MLTFLIVTTFYGVLGHFVGREARTGSLPGIAVVTFVLFGLPSLAGTDAGLLMLLLAITVLPFAVGYGIGVARRGTEEPDRMLFFDAPKEPPPPYTPTKDIVEFALHVRQTWPPIDYVESLRKQGRLPPAERDAPRAGPDPRTNGARRPPPEPYNFCPWCGTGLLGADWYCEGCHRELPTEAV